MKNKKLIVGLLACLLAVSVPFMARSPNIKAKAITFSGDTQILACMPFSVKNGSISGLVPVLYFRFGIVDIGGASVVAPTYFSQFNAGENNVNYRFDSWPCSFLELESNGRYRFTTSSNRLYYLSTRADYVGSSVGGCIVDSYNFYVHSSNTDFNNISTLTTNVYSSTDTILINFRNTESVALFTVEINLTSSMDLVDYSASGYSLLFSNIGFNSYDSAYEQGLQIGFNQGYEQGVEDSIGGNMFGVLARGVDAFLDIHLIGDISIKHLIQISLGAVLLGFFIKIFLGG